MQSSQSSTLDSLVSINPKNVISAEDFNQVVIKSRQSFDNLFNGAREIIGVTYADSPDLIFELFTKKNLERLELVVGDASDYREKLQGKLKLAEQLESLKSEGKLLLYVSDKMIHAKFYFVKTIDGNLNVIVSSANLTRNAQDASYQKNIADVYTKVHLKKYTWLRDLFENNYDELKSYASLFMEDLTELFEQQPEKEKKQVLKEWLNTDKQTAEEQQISIINQEIVKRALLTSEDDIEFIMDVKSLPKKLRRDATTILSKDKSVVKKQEQRYSINAKQFLERRTKKYGIPIMCVNEEENIVRGIKPGLILTEQPSEPNLVNDALDHIESFFLTVDRLGQTNNTTFVKAHMYEALLYFLYAPFSNWHIRWLKQYDATSEKPFPHLYIWGESNAGKGTLASFALRLISLNLVTTAVDAQTMTPGGLYEIKTGLSTSFPLPLDDITSKKLSSLEEMIRNYYKNWSLETIFPALIFITNDHAPKSWLKNRVKFLTFDVRFERSPRNTAEINKIIKKTNPIFKWVSYGILNDIEPGMTLDKDFLKPIRTVMMNLYEYANRPLPEYFPIEPVEELFDIGREKWKKLYEQDLVSEEMKKEQLILSFEGSMQSWQIMDYHRMIPSNTRSKQLGTKIVIHNPKEFVTWLPKKYRKKGSVVGRLKNLLG